MLFDVRDSTTFIYLIKRYIVTSTPVTVLGIGARMLGKTYIPEGPYRWGI